MSRSNVVEALRRETADAHARVESHFAELLAPAPRLDTYVAYLTAMCSFHAGVEPALERVHGWHELSPPLVRAERRRLPALARDLEMLSVPLPSPWPAPPIADITSALGVAYVVDGSMLGARVLLRHLATRVPVPAFAFLSAHGERTVDLWRAFVAAATNHVERYGGEDRVVAAAVQTFEHLDRHLTR